MHNQPALLSFARKKSITTHHGLACFVYTEILPQAVADGERAWFERERVANVQALRLMRALLPVNVTGLTVAQLQQKALEVGSLYPLELAKRLKVRELG